MGACTVVGGPAVASPARPLRSTRVPGQRHRGGKARAGGRAGTVVSCAADVGKSHHGGHFAPTPRAAGRPRAGRQGPAPTRPYEYTSTMSPRVSQLKIGTASCIGTRRQPWLAGKTGTEG